VRGSRLLFLILITLVFAASQELLPQAMDGTPENPTVTTRIDEFGPANDCDLSARVDSLFIALNNDPEATGYVIAYTGADVLPSHYGESPMLDRIKRAIAFRKYDSSRIVYVNGGFREAFSTEFFLVPQYGVPPEPTKTVARPKVPKTTFLWSRSWILNEYDDGPTTEFILPEVQARLAEEAKLAEIELAADSDADAQAADNASENEDATSDLPDEEARPTAEKLREQRFSWADQKFGTEVAQLDGAHGVIIFYADDKYYDIARISRFVREGRDIIAAAAKLKSTQIRVVYGGYRDSPGVEYFIVPRGGKAPEPTPEERDPADDQSPGDR
jgi:hypothetical protein